MHTVNTQLVLEIVGYAASGLIAISLMMSSILRLRLLNSVGALFFAIYGVLIHAYPVAVLNGVIVLVNVFYLIKIFKAPEYFQLLELKPDSKYLPYFLDYYGTEIKKILPDFAYRPAPDQIALFILRDCAPVGVFLAREEAPGTWRVVLDFVIPTYRSLKIGRFLFVERAAFFRERGVREIVISPRTAQFGAYLVDVGFVQTGAESLVLRYAE